MELESENDPAEALAAVPHAGDKYLLGPCIARGGMAEVCFAMQTGLAGFEKLVVLKRVLPHLAGEGQFVQMLLDEARLAAALRHPGIVQITDLGRDSETFFLVMEYLRGESVGRLLKRRRQGRLEIPPAVAAFIVSHIADALHYAHTAKDPAGRMLSIIHRDVSPSNIIVTYDGQPTLIDFGIAKAEAHISYTQPGTIKGKFAYASPEQVRSRPLDARSDVFSLGVVLHELLTGRPLFRRDAAISTIQAVTSDTIPPPSTVDSGVPQLFDDVVMCALERDPERRTASAQAFRQAIQAVVREQGLTFGRDQMAAWMKENLVEDMAKRDASERRALRQLRGGVQTSSGDYPAPEPTSQSSDVGSASASSAVVSHTRPTQLASKPASRRLWWGGAVVLVLALLALLFNWWSPSGSEDAQPVEVEIQ